MRTSRFIRFFLYLTPKTIRTVVSCTIEQRLTGLSAEMAYYSMLALFPAILVILTAIGVFEDSLRSLLENIIQVPDVDPQTTLENLVSQLKNVVPDDIWAMMSGFAKEVKKLPTGSRVFSLSFLVIIWIVSGAMNAAMNALDQIHQVLPRHQRSFWKSKLVSIFLTIGTIILVVSASFILLMSKFLIQLFQYMIDFLQKVDQQQIFEGILRESSQLLAQIEIWLLLSWPLALVIIAVAFAFLYRFGPTRPIRGIPILPGALIAAFSWAGLSSLFRIYVENFANYNKIYGAIGTVIVLMLWLYWSSLIMLLGAQLNVTVGQAMKRNQGEVSVRNS